MEIALKCAMISQHGSSSFILICKFVDKVIAYQISSAMDFCNVVGVLF